MEQTIFFEEDYLIYFYTFNCKSNFLGMIIPRTLRSVEKHCIDEQHALFNKLLKFIE